MDLVKGIRAHRRDEEEFIRSKLTEIITECRSADITKKTTAVLKLTHLQMMGYNIAFARFHIVEVMSSPDFANKRIGYLAAAQSFSPTTDVLLLTTNQFKKDLTNGKHQDCSQALTCLSKIITEELGRELEKDVSLLLRSPRPYIRKKALLILYRLIMVHPDTLPIVSARFRERLNDPDPSVLCAAVTVTTELARASPSTFLSLAPVLYQLLMNKDSNNWMLIKIVKLMGVLTPLEPRLGRKLLEPLTTLMRTTRAKSLLYECCSTVTAGMLDHPEAVELCAQRLSEFMHDTDQNLKYLGLLSMRKLIQAHPHLASDHRDNILDCLDDEDIGIRMRALGLVSEFVSKRNLRDISRILLRKLRTACADGFFVEESVMDSSSNGGGGGGSGTLPSSIGSGRGGVPASVDQEAPYREAISKLLLNAGIYKRPTTNFKGGYEMLSTADDFAWYLTCILAGLSEMGLLSLTVRTMIAEQLLELTSRVEALRPVSVKVSLSLLSTRSKGRSGTEDNNSIIDNTDATDDRDKVDKEEDNDEEEEEGEGEDDDEDSENDDTPTTVKPPPRKAQSRSGGGGGVSGTPDGILSATLAGNTAWILGEYAELIEDYVVVIERLVYFPKRSLDAAAQVRIMTSCVKVFVNSRDDQATRVLDIVREYVSSMIKSQFAEVQDRAWFFNSILTEIGPNQREELLPLFSGKLIPVDPRAQSKVPVPDDLDIETPLLDIGTESIVTYLKRSVSDANALEGDDDGMIQENDEIVEYEDEDQDQDLFQEAVFSNSALSMNVGSYSGVSSNYAEGAAVLPPGSLIVPVDEGRDGNPFYLNGNRQDGNAPTVSSSITDTTGRQSGNRKNSLKHHQSQQLQQKQLRKLQIEEDNAAAERSAARFGYESGILSSDAAVVIEEENPLGLPLSDEEGNEITHSKLEERLQEAFLNNSSTTSGTRPGNVVERGVIGSSAEQVGKKDKKKKKKKKKSNNKSGSGIKTTSGKGEVQQGSLIDFDDELTTVGTPDVANSNPQQQQPKHVAADTLLM